MCLNVTTTRNPPRGVNSRGFAGGVHGVSPRHLFLQVPGSLGLAVNQNNMHIAISLDVLLFSLNQGWKLRY